MAQLPLTARRWTRVEYERLVAFGVFQGERLRRPSSRCSRCPGCRLPPARCFRLPPRPPADAPYFASISTTYGDSSSKICSGGLRAGPDGVTATSNDVSTRACWRISVAADALMPNRIASTP